MQQDLQDFIDQTQVNEIMAVSNIFSHEARLYSYQLLAQALQEAARPVAAQQA